MRKKEIKETIEVTPVTLKPIFGMSPPVYLSIIYALVIVLIIFFVGFLPGIIKSGKRVTFTSYVEFSSVYVDGKYIGTTPSTQYLSPGEHEVVYSFKDVAHTKETIKVSHPVFLTWLIPRKQTHNSPYYLTKETIPLYLTEILSEVMSYSSVIEYDEVTHYPPLIANAVSTFIASKVSDFSSIESFLLDASLFITSKEMLDDVREGVSLLEEYGYQGKTIQQEIGKIELLFNENTKTIGNVKNPTNTSQISFSTLNVIDFDLKGVTYKDAPLVVGKEVPLSYPGVQEMSQDEQVDSFSISLREISEYQYAHFIEAHPYWGKQNIETLMKEGLVDASYLSGMYPTTKILSTTPIRNISYYAAKAFTEWISEVSGREVSLPTNSEFELALKNSNSIYQKSLFVPSKDNEIIALLGGVWEFTRDEYIPLNRYLGRTLENNELVDDIIIKGGSYLNDSSMIDKATIGVIKKNQCSATTGFRVVWK
ncbi:MAG: PEGA domain-containing protein [Spirochaetia bacterium]|nr:PEGA domain-containing protein [Spirochaetia bacterium]